MEVLQVELVVLDEIAELQVVLVELAKLEVIDQPKSKVKEFKRRRKYGRGSVGEVAKKTARVNLTCAAVEEGRQDSQSEFNLCRCGWGAATQHS